MPSSYKPFTVQPHQSEPARSTEVPPPLSGPDSWSNGQGVITFSSLNPTSNEANYGPLAAHVTGLPPLVMGLVEGNQSHGVSHLTSEIFVPLMPGQPEPGLEYHTSLGYETPNVGPPNGPPHHAFNVPGPFHGNPGPVGMPPSLDALKDLAIHYIYNPRSHVEKLRVKRERTGRSKVLIVLEIDDTMPV